MTVALIVIVVMSLVGGGTVYSSQQALPGDFLYPTKLDIEDFRLSLSSPETDAKLYLLFSAERVEEMQQLYDQGKMENFNSVAQRLETQLRSYIESGAVLNSQEQLFDIETLSQDLFEVASLVISSQSNVEINPVLLSLAYSQDTLDYLYVEGLLSLEVQGVIEIPEDTLNSLISYREMHQEKKASLNSNKDNLLNSTSTPVIHSATPEFSSSVQAGQGQLETTMTVTTTRSFTSTVTGVPLVISPSATTLLSATPVDYNHPTLTLTATEYKPPIQASLTNTPSNVPTSSGYPAPAIPTTIPTSSGYPPPVSPTSEPTSAGYPAPVYPTVVPTSSGYPAPVQPTVEPTIAPTPIPTIQPTESGYPAPIPTEPPGSGYPVP